MKRLTLALVSLLTVSAAHAYEYYDQYAQYQPKQQSAIISQDPPPGMQDPFAGQQPPPPPVKTYDLPPRKPIYEERMQFDASCTCYIKVYNQIGWQ